MPLIAGEGCVYGAFAGTLTLRISDVTMTEAAAWVREAQQRFSTHPGLRGWRPLHRSFPYELDANRAISGPVCNNLPKNDGQQCDEYPFAATREGVAFGPKGTYWDEGRQRRPQPEGRADARVDVLERVALLRRHVLRRRPELTP